MVSRAGYDLAVTNTFKFRGAAWRNTSYRCSPHPPKVMGFCFVVLCLF